MISITLQQMADLVGGTLQNCTDKLYPIYSIHPLSNSDYIANSLAFVKDTKYLDTVNQGVVDVVITNEKIAAKITNSEVAILVVTDPHSAFAKIAQVLDTTPKVEAGIHPTAVIDPSVQLGDNVSIGAYAVIGKNVIIGDNSIIESHCSVGQNCKLGKNVHLYPHVVLYHGVVLGDDVKVHSLTVLGSDGFGYANERGKWIKIPQVGTTVIGDRTEIGSLTSIDRGALNNTIVENDVIIDNHIHLGHNAKVGMGTAMAGGTIVAGSTTIGKYCIIGGASVFNGHINIADFVTVSGMAMVPQSLTQSHQIYSSGLPVEENKKWLRSVVMLRYERLKEQQQKLAQQEAKVAQLEKAIADLQSKL